MPTRKAGGNFIDTADVYQFGQSEELLGTRLQGRREDFVLATKFSNGAQPNANRLVTGNSRKALVASVDASLRRLKTDRGGVQSRWLLGEGRAAPEAPPAIRGLRRGKP